jgi:hypothetical protein
LVTVKNGLRGVAENLLFSFALNSPNNSCPEAWYWESPETINGALNEYVSLQMRLRAANRELALTPEMLDEIRKPRTF